MQRASLSLHEKVIRRLEPCFAATAPRRLRFEWRLWALAGVPAVGFGLLFLATRGIISSPRVGVLSATAALLYVLFAFRCHLKLNHRIGEQQPLPRLGAANRLTFVRGLLLCILAGFIGGMPAASHAPEIGRAWLPGILYLTIAILDGLDGMVARRTRLETQMGFALDTKMDAFGLLVAIAVAIQIGQLPAFYFIAAAAYYIFTAAAALRRRLDKPVLHLKPRPAARAIAGMTMGLVGVALLPVYGAPATTIAAGLFMLPFCYGFLRDWLVVCETVQIDRHQQTLWEPHVKRFFTEWLPPVFRLMLGFTALGLLVQGIDLPDLQPRSGFIEARSCAGLLPAGLTILILMIITGWLGRSAALGLALFLGLYLHEPGLAPDWLVIFVCAVCLMLSGTGQYSLWQPEDRFLDRRGVCKPSQNASNIQ